MSEMGANGARHFCLSPTNPDLAHILADTDFNVENYTFWIYFWIPDFQIPGFPDSWILEPGSWLWLAVARGGGSPVARSRRFLGGTPGPQNSGDPKG